MTSAKKSTSYFLLIDSSGKCLSLALARDGSVICYRNLALGHSLSERFMSEIDKFLNKAKCPIQKIDAFGIGLGPGSFTSLRIGMAAVKSFAFALEKPIIGVSSLDLIARNIVSDLPIVVLMDARRGKFFTAEFDGKTHLIRKPYALKEQRDVLKSLIGRVAIIGDGLFCCEPVEKKILVKHGCVLCETTRLWMPQAKNMAVIVAQRFAAKQFDDVHTLVPLYLYEQDCQINRRGASGCRDSKDKNEKCKF